MSAWPATLPQAITEGYSVSPLDQTIRTDMEVGSARVRRRTSARLDKVSVSWVMTDAQFSTFRTWFEDSTTGIAGGSAWFAIRLAVGGSALMETKDARFVGPFNVDRTGLHWKITASLETR